MRMHLCEPRRDWQGTKNNLLAQARMQSGLLDVCQQFFDFSRCQKQAFPQVGLPVFIKSIHFNLASNFRPSLERRFSDTLG